MQTKVLKKIILSTIIAMLIIGSTFMTGSTRAAYDTTTEFQKTDTETGITVNVVATVGGDMLGNKDQVVAGEIINYEITIVNSSKNTIEGVSTTFEIPENTTLVKVNPEYKNMYTGEEELREKPDEYLIENQDRTISAPAITIEPEKTRTYKCMVKVNSNLTEQIEEEAKITVNYLNNKQISVNPIHTLVPGELEIILNPLGRDGTEKLDNGNIYEQSFTLYNKSNRELNNIEATININGSWELLEIMNGSNGKHLAVTGENKIKIDSIPANSSLDIWINAKTKTVINNEQTAQMSIIAKTEENKLYKSNTLVERIDIKAVELELESSLNDEKEIKYTINIKNTGTLDLNDLRIVDQFSELLKIKSVKLDGNECEYQKYTDFSSNSHYDTITINTKLKKDDNAIIEIIGQINDKIQLTETMAATNKALVYDGILIGATEQKTNYIGTSKTFLDNGKSQTDNSENISIRADANTTPKIEGNEIIKYIVLSISIVVLVFIVVYIIINKKRRAK